MLDSIPEMRDATKTRIMEYIKRKQHQQQQQPAATSAGHRLRIIEELNNNHSELYNVFYAHLHKIMFNEYDNIQEYREAVDYLNNVINYYRVPDGRFVKIADNDFLILKNVFTNKTIEFFRNHATTIRFNANVVLYPYQRMQDQRREPYNTIRIEETIDINTELQSFYNNALQQHGIIVSENEYETHRIGKNPFPQPITGFEYIRQKIVNHAFIFLSNEHQLLREIRFYDSIEVIPRDPEQEPMENPECKGNTCTIMGGRRQKTGRHQKTGKNSRKRKHKTKRFYRR
jgi:hypothetical protein